MPALKINGQQYPMPEDPRTTLLDTLREQVGLMGTKKGCDHGQCGACTVLLEGRRVNACLILSRSCEDLQVTTVEGLERTQVEAKPQIKAASEEFEGNSLHPLQIAFIKYDAFQCGYCTAGQLCSAAALIEEIKNEEVSVVSGLSINGRSISREDLRERMSGNLCRCGAYPHINNAITEVLHYEGIEVEDQCTQQELPS